MGRLVWFGSKGIVNAPVWVWLIAAGTLGFAFIAGKHSAASRTPTP